MRKLWRKLKEWLSGQGTPTPAMPSSVEMERVYDYWAEKEAREERETWKNIEG